MSPAPGRRLGGSTLGCLVSLALFVAALYCGERIGQVYLRYFRLRDAMRAQAIVAPNLDNGVLGRRLDAHADSIFHRPLRFRVRRGGSPPRITIQTEYTDSIVLPFYKRAFVFRPKVEEPL